MISKQRWDIVQVISKNNENEWQIYQNFDAKIYFGKFLLLFYFPTKENFHLSYVIFILKKWS